jgi:hypothetical protein
MDGIGKFPHPPSQEDVRHLVAPDSPTDVTFEADITNYTLYPNRWARWRSMFREPAAEFLGTMVLVLFGNGVLCQVSRTSESRLQGYIDRAPQPRLYWALTQAYLRLQRG